MRRREIALASLLLMGLLGCMNLRPARLAEAPVDRVWPGPPARARIQFLYAVSTPRDLQIVPGFWGKLWRAVKGEKEPRLLRPYGVEVDTQGRIFVVDTSLGLVHLFSPPESAYETFPTRGNGLISPIDVALDRNGLIYVSDSLNFRIKVLSPEGELRELFGESGDGPGYFSSPKGVAADSEGHIYVVDGLFDNVQVFDRQGRLLMAFGSPGSGPGEFWLPSGIFIDERDTIYVSDSYNQRVQVFRYLKGEGEETS